MSCPCQEPKGNGPRQGVNTWGCGCKVMPSEPKSKGVVKFCDFCDPCNECVSTVKLCAFVVPTLDEGRYYRNSFVFVQEDDSTYFISDDRNEIPFGSRPKFIDDFDPAEQLKRTMVFDLKNGRAYVYGNDGAVLELETVKPVKEVYPVGSVVMSFNDSVSFDGTWEKLELAAPQLTQDGREINYFERTA